MWRADRYSHLEPGLRGWQRSAGLGGLGKARAIQDARRPAIKVFRTYTDKRVASESQSKGCLIKCIRIERVGRGVRALRRIAAIAVVMSLCPAFAADDNYLRAVEREAGKLGAAPPQYLADEGTAGLEADRQPALSRDRFEATLRDRYVGTYQLYGKLPDRSRQEVFADFQRGATIEEVRRKIVDRLLQQ